MDSVNATPISSHVSAAPAPEWFLWAATAAVAAPVTIILHELGHFAASHGLGFPDVDLHYGSVSDGAAEAGFPSWQQGIRAAAGPLVTVGIVLGCCYAVLRVGARPWSVAPAFAAGVRSIMIGMAYFIARIRYPGVEGNFDELNAARHLGLSTDLVVAANVLILVAAWTFLIVRIGRGRRIATLGSILMGVVAGLAIYIGWLGPWLLP